MSALSLFVDAIATAPIDIPDPDPAPIPGFEGPTTTILGWMKWGGLALAVAGVIIVAYKLFVNSHRGEGGRELGQLGFVAIGVALIGGAASIVGFIAGA